MQALPTQAVADQATAGLPWSTGVLDALDLAIVVVDGQGEVLHANRMARHELTADHPLQLFGGRVRARETADVAPLRQALVAALTQGRRRLLTLDAQGEALSLAVVPLPEAPNCVVLMLGRRRLGDRCLMHWFAAEHGLTPGEQRVLDQLAAGQSPDAVARELGVGIATVRTHIGSVRRKVGATSIRALLHRLAGLPPMAARLPQ